jgi:uncharacterized membrane protein
MIPLRLVGKNCRTNGVRKTPAAVIVALLAALIFALPAEVKPAVQAGFRARTGEHAAAGVANEGEIGTATRSRRRVT